MKDQSTKHIAGVVDTKNYCLRNFFLQGTCLLEIIIKFREILLMNIIKPFEILLLYILLLNIIQFFKIIYCNYKN